ncbi:MAG TPA: inositol monophosphatase [Anaerolineaceae bacterium]|nr:inositol monophosphatase [Anaerolineaceae bacterium]
MNNPIQIVVGSRNPVKIQCVRMGFEKMFPQAAYDLNAVDVPSGVSAQPDGSAEMLRGALNRAEAARNLRPNADYWVGVEGGTEDGGVDMQAYAWVVVLSPHGVGKGRTGAFYLPKAIADLVRQGKELGEADDIFFGRSNSKQANGAIGLLTGDVIDRAQYYEHAVIMALIPFKNPDLYQISAAG